MTDEVRQRVASAQRRREHPRQRVHDDGHARPERGDDRRLLAEAAGCGTPDVLEEEPHSRQHHHRGRQPVPDRDRHGVQPEVVAQLVGQHSLELRRAEVVHRKAGDQHQMSTARERVQLVGGQHPHDVAARRQTVRLSDLGPQRLDDVGFVNCWASCAEQRGEHEHLDGLDEEQQPGSAECDDDPPEVDPAEPPDGQPDHEQRDQ